MNAATAFPELPFKAKCRTCRHLVERRDDGYTVIGCGSTAHPTRRRPLYCIDQRDQAGPCGPDARLWEAAAW